MPEDQKDLRQTENPELLCEILPPQSEAEVTSYYRVNTVDDLSSLTRSPNGRSSYGPTNTAPDGPYGHQHPGRKNGGQPYTNGDYPRYQFLSLAGSAPGSYYENGHGGVIFSRISYLHRNR